MDQCWCSQIGYGKILKTKFAKSIKVYNDDDIGRFARKKTKDDEFDIIITFGYFPVSLYKPGNVEKEDSIAEKFLEGGDMFMNAADYIFYVTQGGGANGENGLKTITDSNFDMWGDGIRSTAAESPLPRKLHLAFLSEGMSCMRFLRIMSRKRLQQPFLLMLTVS